MPSNPQRPTSGDPEPSRAAIPARQARSQRTAERIVAAAVDLLGEKGFEDMSVGEIATRAGVSVGGFYARFPGKEALLQHLQGSILGGILESARALFSPAATEGLGARAIVARYMTMATEGFRRHRVVLAQVSLRSRTSSDPGFRRQVLEMNIELHDLFRARLRERSDEIGHTDPRPAMDIALTATSAVMREYVLFAELRPQFAAIDDETLIGELTDLFCAYLRVES